MEEEVTTNHPAKAGKSKSAHPKLNAWPNLVWIIFLMMVFLTVLFWGVSFLAYAPLEEMAEWAKTPNPAKAPWYFIGLQELLVYFDPWIAGVMLPNQIIIGLILIPYVDITPLEQGNYDFSKRRFAVWFFTIGIVFWFLLIVVGQFLRGPSWQIYWPLIDYDFGSSHWTREGIPLKEGGAELRSLTPFTGALCLIGFFTVGMVVPFVATKLFPSVKQIKVLDEYLKELGFIKYFVVQSHLLMMLGTFLKIFLRLGFKIKYVIETPWFNI